MTDVAREKKDFVQIRAPAGKTREFKGIAGENTSYNTLR
jgi:hypothetical protein